MTSNEKGAASLPKLVADRIGRMFNLVFNRVAMYSPDHPSTQESIKLMCDALLEGFQHVSPLTIILDRENIYVEEEPLDKGVNVQRLVMHMKKTGVQSVSFERGCAEPILLRLARVFGDSNAYPTADDMKNALLQQGLEKVRINHVFFKKVTTDEEVIDKIEGPRGGVRGFTQVLIDSTADQESTEQPTPTEIPGDLSWMPYSQDLFQNLTPSVLLENPTMVSEQLLEAESKSQEGRGGSSAGASAIVHGIRQLRQRIEDAQAGAEGAESTEDLVGAAFQLKEKIRDGLELRKSQGEQVPGEDLIAREMDELTDQVMIQLVREEYQKGEVSVKRLAQILRRMMPDVRELRRLLPKLKEALLAEGMPLADYLQLIRELERELRSDELAYVLEEGAEEVGLSVGDLMREIGEDPGGAANLIVLAAEIRCLGGEEDQGLLSQILVDYVEKIGKELAFEQARSGESEGVNNLRNIVAQVQEKILGELQNRLKGNPVVERVREAVEQDRDQRLEELQHEFFVHQFVAGNQPLSDPQALVQAVERAYSDSSQQEEVLASVVRTMEEQGIDAGPLLGVMGKKASVAPGEVDPQKAPQGAFNRTIILFFLREEFKRARRYGHIFSVLLLSIKQARALKPIPIGMIRPHEIRNALMVQLAEHLRDVDLVGLLEENKIMVLLPFTGGDGVEVVERRILGALEGKPLVVRNVPMQVGLAISREPFSKERAPSLKALFSYLEENLAEAMKS